jgi:transposase-like protein
MEHGEAIKEIALLLVITERSVRCWRDDAQYPRKKSERKPGKPGYLSSNEIAKLERERLKGAYAHGYAESYRTSDRLGHVI